MFKMKSTLTALAAALLLASCGGETGQTANTGTGITAIKVMGDSLADSGTFTGVPGYGRVFSVQNDSADQSDDANAIPWPERINQSYGLPQLCNVYKYEKPSFIANPVAGCTNYAIGASRINNPTAVGGNASPQSIIKQITDASNKGLSSSDLVLMDIGGNDAADLVLSYFSGTSGFSSQLTTLLPEATVKGFFAQGNAGIAKAGGAYMVALADTFAGSVQDNILSKGVTHVAILNIPGIINTPRFQMALSAVTDTATRASLEAMFKSWIEAYNAELVAQLGGNSSVLIVDFYTEFNNQFLHPEQYGLTNVKAPACPITGVGSDGLPTYNFATCTATALSANPPATSADKSATWWTHYAFSDGFHPTPYGYKLVGQLVSRSLLQARWL